MVHRLAAAIAACVCVLVLVGHARAQDGRWSPATPGVVLTLDRDALAGESAILERFPLPDGTQVDLVLEPFGVFAPDARVVVADGAGERPADFDPSSIAFWRGTVSGYPGSHVFLSVAEGSTVGRVELGASRPTYAISSSGGDPAEIVVYRQKVGMAADLAPSPCGVGIVPVGPANLDPPPGGDGPGSVLGPTYGPMVRGLRMAKLAVDADYAMYQLFEHERAALTFLAQMYAAASDVFIRDTGVRLDLVFLRVWTTRDHPYERGVGYPQIPPGVVYDVSQLMSGRKDAPYGGQAAGICATASWVGYGIGRLSDTSIPTVFNHDIGVVLHELGHSLGTGHTHQYGIDECATASSQPRRGTIMSYCSTTFSGGAALRDMHFHAGLRDRIRDCVSRRLHFDCNQNHIADALDIASGRSTDTNGNGIPDECEDCNGNGVLDDADIASGTSLDLNENGIPDECEPDCNANGVPDDQDIADGVSQDANGDAIPDECQADCDGNGVFDWVDIVNDMSLDLDRDAILDACQDCDGDGVSDVIAMDHAHNTWTADLDRNTVNGHHFQTGVLRSTSADGLLSEPMDVLVTPDRRVLVASGADARIVEFDLDGAFVRDLVTTGTGGLIYPTAMAIGIDGELLVADRDANAVRRYDLATGSSLGDLVGSGAGGLIEPYSLIFGPSGNLFVGTDNSGVVEYDGVTGAHVRQFVQPGDGGIAQSRGILFVPGLEAGTWRFLVADMETDAIMEFDADTGAYVGQFSVGTWRGRLADPWALRLGPDGVVYASIHRASAGSSPLLFPPAILGFDATSGSIFLALVAGVDAATTTPTGFDFVPGDAHDCNLNRIPDACDIADGRSDDRNRNGVPDECESLCTADCDGDGELGIFDFLCFQTSFDAREPIADCTGDGSFDVFDFLCFQAAFMDGCP
ncbi:MAG: M12 family metallo-peptidase [Phycisphaera sp.]|nr:MAG: M12 family metallo-peptidase [Phycisphaera sp.]